MDLILCNAIFHFLFLREAILRVKPNSNRRAAGIHPDFQQFITSCWFKIISIMDDGGEAIRVHSCSFVFIRGSNSMTCIAKSVHVCLNHQCDECGMNWYSTVAVELMGMLWRMILPGPFTAVLKKPSPPKSMFLSPLTERISMEQLSLMAAK